MFSSDRTHYSTRGSYLSCRRESENGLALGTIRRGGFLNLFKLTAEHTDIEPWELSVKNKNNDFKLCFFGENGVCFKGSGDKLTLSFLQHTDCYIADFIIPDGNKIKMCDCASGAFNFITVKKGSFWVDAPRKKGSIKKDYIKIDIIPDENNEFEFTFVNSESDLMLEPPKSYDEYSADLKESFNIWEKQQKCSNEFERECAYILWSNIAPKGKIYPTEAIVMSKSGMSSVWSWDNTFNALDLADKDCIIAFNQFMMPYRFLDEAGRIPDSISPCRVERNFVKPPVQGWVYKQMMLKNEYFSRPEIIEQVYFPMRMNTQWWLNSRGETPCYYHGNDSGWDNGTCFDQTEHIETPELLAFLSVQCGLLSCFADRLGFYTDKLIYKALSDELCKKSVSDYWDGKLFVRNAQTKEPIHSDCLLPLRMIVLGKSLPRDIREYIVSRLEEAYITPYGLVSEPIDSPEYIPDGYWRGAIWGPEQIFFCLSLWEMGYSSLADKIATGYKQNAEKNGFSENHNGTDGSALRCKGYSWSVNAYRII